MTRDHWKRIQQRLSYLGYNPGPIDGIRGRMTTNAVRAFQAAQGLLVDGIVGPRTSAALFGSSEETLPEFDNMPWYDEALKLVGTQEYAGAASNPTILNWAEELDIAYGDDEIPWCGLFVAHCIGSTLPNEAMPSNPLGARAWGRVGMECSPQFGSILVFWRGSRDGWKGHVGFYRGEDATHYHVLGGNQSNAVNIRRITKGRLLTARWPVTGPAPTGLVLAGDVSAQTSNNNEA